MARTRALQIVIIVAALLACVPYFMTGVAAPAFQLGLVTGNHCIIVGALKELLFAMGGHGPLLVGTPAIMPTMV